MASRISYVSKLGGSATISSRILETVKAEPNVYIVRGSGLAGER